MLLEKLLKLLERRRPAFVQRRTYERFVTLLLWLFCALGRKTLTAALGVAGRIQVDWSENYYLFSRAKWEMGALFEQVFKVGLSTCPPIRFITVAIDIRHRTFGLGY